MTRVAALLTVVLLAVGACGGNAVRPTGLTVPTATLPPGDPYVAAVRLAHARHLTVWIDTDAAQAWREGSAAYRATMSRVLALAALPGVTGVKIADELGYDDGYDDDPAGMRAFVVRTARVLHSGRPHVRVMADLVVPELGCAPGLARVRAASRSCMREVGGRHPALRLPAVDELLATGSLDVVDLSTSLLGPATYAKWGISMDTAQRAAWHEVQRRRWASHTTLIARKALAGVRGFSGDAAGDVRTYVDIPVSLGARGADIWTWAQRYRGAVVQLAAPGPASNQLWRLLVERRRSGVRLVTSFTPSTVLSTVPHDLTFLSTAMSDVLIAAGTG
jgi:hypothetical protein